MVDARRMRAARTGVALVVGGSAMLDGCSTASRAEPAKPLEHVGSVFSEVAPAPAKPVEEALLPRFCPLMTVDAGDGIYAFTDDPAIRHRPAQIGLEPGSRLSTVGTLLDAGYVRPLAVLESDNWHSMSIMSTPALAGTFIAGRAEPPGPCGLALSTPADVLARYDAAGRCVFATTTSSGGVMDALAVFDEAHVYVGGNLPAFDTGTFIERYDAAGERVFRKQYLEHDFSVEVIGGPFTDWGEQRVVATQDGVIISHDRGASLEALDAKGRRRWQMKLEGGPPWLVSDLSGNLYATTFRVDRDENRKPVPHTGPGVLLFHKIDPKGRVVWERSFRDELHVYVLGLVTDAMNDVWMAGLFHKELRLADDIVLQGMGDTTFTTFVARFDPTGRTEWASAIGEVITSSRPEFFGRRWLSAGPTGDVVMRLDHLGPLWDVPVRPTEPPRTKSGHECSVLRLRSDGDSTQISRVW